MSVGGQTTTMMRGELDNLFEYARPDEGDFPLRGSPPRSGYWTIWAATLERALRDLESPDFTIRTQAERWVFLPDPDFDEICHGIGVDPDYVRRMALNVLQRTSEGKRHQYHTIARVRSYLAVDIDEETKTRMRKAARRGGLAAGIKRRNAKLLLKKENTVPRITSGGPTDIAKDEVRILKKPMHEMTDEELQAAVEQMRGAKSAAVTAAKREAGPRAPRTTRPTVIDVTEDDLG